VRPIRGYYLCMGAAGTVEVAVDVTAELTVEVGAVCSAGFGASCFWHPAKANTAATVATAMIARIFFMILHPLSSHMNNSSAFVSREIALDEKRAAAMNLCSSGAARPTTKRSDYILFEK